MDLNKTGGPAYPTLSGGPVDDKVFRWEGMTLFDHYLGHFIASGYGPEDAIKETDRLIQLRKKHLMETNDDQ